MMKEIDFKTEYIKLAHKILRGLLSEEPDGQTLLDELIANLAGDGKVSDLAAAPTPAAGPVTALVPSVPESVPQIALQPTHKKCHACGPQPISKFNPHKTTKDGLHFLCQDCQSAKAKKANTFKAITEPASSEAPPNLNGHSDAPFHPSATEGKRCATCTKKGDPSLKPLSAFYVNRQNPDGHDYSCKACTSDRIKAKRPAATPAPPPSVDLNPSVAISESIPPAPAKSAPPAQPSSPAPTNGFRRATGTVVAEMETERPLRERMKNAGREVYRTIAQNRSITQGIRSTLADLYQLTAEQVEVVVSEQLAMWPDRTAA